MTRAPTLELLWWEGCPSTGRALEELRSALSELGLQDAEVAMREIRTDDEAEAAEFTGSPTILIDGVELMTLIGRGGDDGPAGLNCRVYPRRDGRMAPTPDPLDVRAALQMSHEVR
jgi:hypothetical protein